MDDEIPLYIQQIADEMPDTSLQPVEHSLSDYDGVLDEAELNGALDAIAEIPHIVYTYLKHWRPSMN